MKKIISVILLVSMTLGIAGQVIDKATEELIQKAVQNWFDRAMEYQNQGERIWFRENPSYVLNPVSQSKHNSKFYREVFDFVISTRLGQEYIWSKWEPKARELFLSLDEKWQASYMFLSFKSARYLSGYNYESEAKRTIEPGFNEYAPSAFLDEAADLYAMLHRRIHENKESGGQQGINLKDLLYWNQKTLEILKDICNPEASILYAEIKYQYYRYSFATMFGWDDNGIYIYGYHEVPYYDEDDGTYWKNMDGTFSLVRQKEKIYFTVN